MKELSICCSLDSNYTEQLCVSIASVLKNSGGDSNIKFYVLDGGLEKTDKSKIEALKKIKDFNIEYFPMNPEDFALCPLLRTKDDADEAYRNFHVTLPTYFRFLIADVLKNLDKVLYLDCDVIVKNSLEPLFQENIEKYAAAMILDAKSEKEAERMGLGRYFNAGVMLINLNYWRRNNVKQSLFEYAQNFRDKILWQDQDIINAVLDGVIKELPSEWNYQYFHYKKQNAIEASRAVILHFAGDMKPWLQPMENEIYEEYFKYLKLTPFKNKIEDYRLNLNRCWSEIAKNYKFLLKQDDIIKTASNNKISKVYEEITRNYKYTDSITEKIKKELEQASDEKISKVYGEITKNYKYTEDKAEEIKAAADRSCDEKLSKVYGEITKNYKYTDDKAEEIKTEAGRYTDEKAAEIKLIMKEIKEEALRSSALVNEEAGNIKKEFAEYKENTEKNISKIIETAKEARSYTDAQFKNKTDEIKSYTDAKFENKAAEIKSYTDSRLEDKTAEIQTYINARLENTNQKLKAFKEQETAALSKINEDIAETRSFAAAEAAEIKNEIQQKIQKEISPLQKNENRIEENLVQFKEETKTAVQLINSETENIKKELAEHKENTEKNISEILETVSAVRSYTDLKAEEMQNKLLEQKEAADKKFLELDGRTAEIHSSINIKLEDKINEITSRTDAQFEDKTNEIKSYTDLRLENKADEIKNYTNSQLENKTAEIKSYTDAKLEDKTAETQTYIDAQLENTNQQLEIFKAQEADALSKLNEDIAETRSFAAAEAAGIKNEIQQEIQKEISSLQENKIRIEKNLEELDKETSEKISAVQEELSRNSQYTEYLVEISEEKLKDSINETEKDIRGGIEKIYAALNNDLNSRIDETAENIEQKLNNFEEDIKTETALKYKELHAYADDSAAKLYKEIISSGSMLEDSFSRRLNDLYRLNNEASGRIDALNSKTAGFVSAETVKLLEKQFSQEASEKDLKYAALINQLHSEFEEKINNQRLKYENKLAAMETQINELLFDLKELKKTPLARFLEKMGKKK